MPLFKKLALTWSVGRDLFTRGTAARTRSRPTPLAPTRCAKERTTDVLARPRRRKNDAPCSRKSAAKTTQGVDSRKRTRHARAAQIECFQNFHARFREDVRVDRHLHNLFARLWNTFAGQQPCRARCAEEPSIIRPNAGVYRGKPPSNARNSPHHGRVAWRGTAIKR